MPWIDILDILIVAVVVYPVLLALRSLHIRSVVVGAILLGGLYLVAEFFGFRLTPQLLRMLFIVVGLALIIVFHQDIRRFLEGLAARAGRLLRARDETETVTWIDAIIETLDKLANAKIGALVIVQGEENVEQHLAGGIELDGYVSGPLLESIFHPQSSGHDGAVLIVDNRVVGFGYHLPLSDDMQQLAGTGTRHAAALGLAEVCDAICIVVSEERGSISVAQHQALQPMANPAELHARLEKLTQPHTSQLPHHRWKSLFTENLFLKVMSLGVAGLLWFVFVFAAVTEYRTFSVPVEPAGVPEGLTVESVNPKFVTVSVAAPRRVFYLMRGENIHATLPVVDLSAGNQRVFLTVADIQIPAGVSINSISPQSVEVTLAGKSAKSQ